MPAPAAPTSLAVDETAIFHRYRGRVSNKSAVRLTFTNNAIATAQHRIERSEGSNWVLVGIANVGASLTVVGELPNATALTLRMRAEDEEGVSAWATVAHATAAFATELAPPTAPANLAVSGIHGYGATLTWEDQSDNEALFEIHVRRGLADVRKVLVAGMTESHALDLSALYSGVVTETLFTVKVRALGGKALAGETPPWKSAWSDDVTFLTGEPAVLITSPLSVRVERLAPFSYAITTNIEATIWGATGLPDGLTRTENIISGAVTAALGRYTITISAEDGSTADERALVLTVVAPGLIITSPTEAKALLGVPFSFTLTARRSFGALGVVTWTVEHAPGWLELDAATGQLTGTPDAEGVHALAVRVTDGTRNGGGTLTLTVPALSITSAAAITAFVDVEFRHQLTATAAATWELIEPPAWLRIEGDMLIGTPPELGATAVDVVATFEPDADSQTITITARALISVPADCVEGWQGEPILELVTYNGACSVEHWYLVGGPPGVDVGTLECPGPYADASRSIGIVGTPTVAGAFWATVIAQTCCGGLPGLFRAPVCFHINGELFVAWLHADRGLYDLQFQVRGGIGKRTVHSYYERAARAEQKASTSEKVTEGTREITVTSDTSLSAVEGDLLTVKRGDVVRLAILIRDGRSILDDTDDVTAVGIGFRLRDSADEDYLFDLPAVLTTVGAHKYFAATLTVTQETLDDLMSDDSVAGATAEPIKTVAEIHYLMDGAPQSSATFGVTFEEDVHR